GWMPPSRRTGTTATSAGSAAVPCRWRTARPSSPRCSRRAPPSAHGAAGAFPSHPGPAAPPPATERGGGERGAAPAVPPRRRGAAEHSGNGGGDVQCAGGRRWRIGIADPLHPGRLALVVAGRDFAVATSGVAERGAHIIDPYTGQPPAGLASITVVGTRLAET